MAVIPWIPGRAYADLGRDVLQMEESQASQAAEPGLQEVLERLESLLQGWSRPEKQVCCLPCVSLIGNAVTSTDVQRAKCLRMILLNA